MTDKWVSLERHYCKYCNTWCGGDKSSIKHHESGLKHKMSVKQYLHGAQKKIEEEKRQSTETRVQLAALEREAMKSYRNDIANAQQHYSAAYYQENPTITYQYGNEYYNQQYQYNQYMQPNQAQTEPEQKVVSTRLQEAQKMRAFYESKGIKIPQEVLDTIKEAETEEEVPPVAEETPAPAPPVNNAPLTGFQAFYKQFYEQYQKQMNPTTENDQEIKKEAPQIKQEIKIEEPEVTQENDFEPLSDSESGGGHPYGGWVTVVREEEEAKNAPVTLIEDEFTKNDPNFQRRQKSLAAQANLLDSDEEGEDKQLSLLEKKDSSARFEEDSDDDIPKKPVTFKKKDRKRKLPMNKGGVRKRLIVSNVHEDD